MTTVIGSAALVVPAAAPGAFVAGAGRRLAAVLLALVCASTLVARPAGAADPRDGGYARAPAPAWIAPVGPGRIDPDTDAVGGQRHLLVDRQYRDDGREVAFHHHYVTEVTGQAGLSDSSKVSVSFDPAYQRLEMHSATVLRDGRTSDRLMRARIDVARTEEAGDQDLLDGGVTARVVLSDVRVGDRVEVRYTLYGRNPVFGTTHHSSWRVRWGVPVARSVLRVTVPAAATLSHTPRPEASVSERTADGLRTLQWRWDDLQPAERAKNAPAWLPDEDRLDVTAYRSWREVADWGTALFEDHPADGAAYGALSRSLRDLADAEGIEPAIAKAIDHVQKRVRYYGLELGENSHRPHSPNEVLANGYGDCKDKALLLASLLNDLGVDAFPILVSSRTRRGVAERLPSPGVFNHVVVLVERGGEQYWVDATDNHQSGLLGRRGQPEYGAGLVLGRPGNPMIERAAPVPERPTSEVTDLFHLSSTGGPVDFTTTTVYRGWEANRFRARLDHDGRRKLQRRYEEFYGEVHGRLRSLAPLRIVEDATLNEIAVTESYRLEEFWDVDRHARSASIEAYAINTRRPLDELPKTVPERTAPLAVRGPVHVAHRIEFRPNVASPERELEERSFGLDGFRYTDSEHVLGDALVFDSELTIAADALDADRTEEYDRFRDRVLRNALSGRFYRQLDRDELDIGTATATLLDEMQELRR